MRFTIAPTLLLLAGAVSAASSWGFSDGSVTLSSKSAPDLTQKFSEKAPDTKLAVKLGPTDTVKVAVTTKEGSKTKRPHQAFVILKDPSGLEAPFPLTVKESGKGALEITQKEIPVQLLLATQPIDAFLILGSFGSSESSVTPIFALDVSLDSNAPKPAYEAPLRYGKLAEIRHSFRGDPKNPPKIVSIVFALAVLATIPLLFVGWIALGANVGHLQKALGSAPLSHAVFFGSVISMEGVFFLYYSTWNLFQTLPVMGVIGVVAFLSGTKALGEVQQRRLAGER